MYKYLILFISIFISIYCKAQPEKIYYDNQWHKTTKGDASQYRTITPLAQGVYKVEDCYINGQLHRLTYQTKIESTNPKYRVGQVISYDSIGHKIHEGYYQDGQRSGLWTYYYENSNSIQQEIYYSNNTDSTLRYDSASHTLTKVIVKRDQQTTLYWDYQDRDTTYTEEKYNSESTVSKRIHKKDTIITMRTVKNGEPENVCYNTAGVKIPCPAKKLFTYAVRTAAPLVNINQFLKENLNYPVLAQKKKVHGRVITKFAVEEDGAISNISIISGIGAGCDEEAMRVMDLMPYWKPGMLNGIRIKAYYTLPIVFTL